MDNSLAEKFDLRGRLKTLIKELSFRRGSVKLASGKESNFYFDMKPAMLHHEAVGLMAELVLDQIRPLNADAIGGIEMGAVPLVAPVVMDSPKLGQPLKGFFIRKEPKDHGTKKRIEGDDISGKRVVILDDVTTTGGSAMEAVRVAHEAGADVLLVLSIVDREEGAAKLYADSQIPFQALFQAKEFLAS
jgi:orotate phosphoribosyltransferase